MKQKTSYKPLCKISVKLTENKHSLRVFTLVLCIQIIRKTESAVVRRCPVHPIKFTLIISSHASCDRYFRHQHLVVHVKLLTAFVFITQLDL